MEYFRIIKSDSPVIASAIHCGHFIREEVKEKLFVTEKLRLTEEDPFTDKFIEFAPSRIIVNASRFEFDLNRPPEKAIYINPEDAWGIKIWNESPSEKIIETSLCHYNKFYMLLRTIIDEYVKKFGKIFLYDVHSFNYQIRSSGSMPDINIGTGNIDNDYWDELIENFINDLSEFDFEGRNLDVRKNIPFKGGYFSKWINENFGNTVCVLSVEVKKIYMNELTCELYPNKAELIKNALHGTMPGIMKNLEKSKTI